MQSFEAHMQFYRSQHTTLGCKVTHMFGIPLIAVSLPIVLFNWQVGVGLFIFGWFLQFVGHYVFQRNNPVFFENPLDPLTYAAALVFCAEEWSKLLTGKPLVDPAS